MWGTDGAGVQPSATGRGYRSGQGQRGPLRAEGQGPVGENYEINGLKQVCSNGTVFAQLAWIEIITNTFVSRTFKISGDRTVHHRKD